MGFFREVIPILAKRLKSFAKQKIWRGNPNFDVINLSHNSSLCLPSPGGFGAGGGGGVLRQFQILQFETAYISFKN
jgi:hypothetical protein